ncbi:hypothetical protein Anas_13128, partial [Armadillidium nasatum]
MDNEIEVKIEDEPFSLSEDFLKDVSEFEKLQTCINPDSDFLLIQDFKGEELELEFDFEEKSFSEDKCTESKPINLKFKDKTQQKIHVSPDKRPKTSMIYPSLHSLQDIKRIAAKYLGEPLASNVDRFSIFRFELDFREWILLKDVSSLRNLDKLEFRESDPVNSENKKRVLFKWGPKVAVVDVERNVSVEELTKLASETFKIREKMELYIYNEDFDEDILLFDANKLKNKQRIEVRRELDASKSYECNLSPRHPSTVDYENITKALLDQYPKMYSKDGYQMTF